MQDPELVFGAVGLKSGNTFLDIGCGPGDFTIRASQIVGNTGKVYALDKRKEAIDEVKQKAALSGSTNIEAKVADITGRLPVGDGNIDVCFISNVLHSLDLAGEGKRIFGEIRRVLKPGMRLAIIEIKKEEVNFGPPMDMRLSQEELEEKINPYGFKKMSVTDLGHNYLIQFSKAD